MSQLNDDEKRRLFMTLDLHTKQNEKIERALYGDEPNKVKGLLDRIEIIEDWITKSKLKIAKISGAIVVIVFLAKMFWSWFLEQFRKK